MSFFDRQGIPETLVRTRPELRNGPRNVHHDDEDDENDDCEDDALGPSDGDEFEDDLLTLRNYSFISTNADAATFEMHCLVQLAMRKWLKAIVNVKSLANFLVLGKWLILVSWVTSALQR
jgi:hypothetical protein